MQNCMAKHACHMRQIMSCKSVFSIWESVKSLLFYLFPFRSPLITIELRTQKWDRIEEGGKENFANGRIIKGDSDHVSGIVHTVTSRTPSQWTPGWQVSSDVLYIRHTCVHIRRSHIHIRPGNEILFPVVKFPSSSWHIGPHTTQLRYEIVSKDTRRFIDATPTIQEQIDFDMFPFNVH